MKNYKEELTKYLGRFSDEKFNKNAINDFFGEENVKNFPKRKIEFPMGQNGSDGMSHLSVNLDTFDVCYDCTIALYSRRIDEYTLKALGDEMLRILKERK